MSENEHFEASRRSDDLQLPTGDYDDEPTCTELDCPECGAPAGSPCQVWCIGDQALAAEERGEL